MRKPSSDTESKDMVKAEIQRLLSITSKEHEHTRKILEKFSKGYFHYKDFTNSYHEEWVIKERHSILRIFENKHILNRCLSTRTCKKNNEYWTILEDFLENCDLPWGIIYHYVANNADAATDFTVEFQQILDNIIYSKTFYSNENHSSAAQENLFMMLLRAELSISFCFFKKVSENFNSNIVNRLFELAMLYNCTAHNDLANNKNALLFAISKEYWSACEFIIKNSRKIALTEDDSVEYRSPIRKFLDANKIELAKQLINLIPDKSFVATANGKLLVHHAELKQWEQCLDLLKKPNIFIEYLNTFFTYLLEGKQYELIAAVINHPAFTLSETPPTEVEIRAYQLGNTGNPRAVIEYIEAFDSKKNLINWAAYGAAENDQIKLMEYLTDEGAELIFIAIGVSKAYQRRQSMLSSSATFFSSAPKEATTIDHTMAPT